MKSKVIMFLAVLVCASTALGGFAHAQDDEARKACIPFDFYAGKQKMPSGTYRIEIDLEKNVISFTDESSKHKMFLMGIADDARDGKWLLVFEHSGDAYALGKLTSDESGWVFHTWMPAPQIGSRNASSQVEVALSR